jgi:four helix bundle protein
MPKLTRFEDLTCWQEARKVVNDIYKVCRINEFRKDYGLSDQVKRSAVSIMANIAEGFSRRSNKEFIQFLFISMSSAAEVQNHLYVALDQKYIDQDQFNKIYDNINKTAMLISGLIRYLRTRQTRQTRQTR